MGQRLVTIATFDQPAQARLAENALKEAGIRAAVNDETLVGVDWLLSGAVGGVKVQVLEEDAEKAVAALEQAFGEHGEKLGAPTPPGEPVQQAEAEPPEEPSNEPTPPVPPVEAETADKPSSRDEFARRLAFTSILGLMLPPVSAYAAYLFLNAAFGEGEISERGRFNTAVGGLLTMAGLAWFCFFLNWFPFFLAKAF